MSTAKVAVLEDRPRWNRRKDARPAELITAALELFVTRGYTATRLEDVAAAAGVSKGTLYLYFDNKEELFKAVIRQGMVSTIEQGEVTAREFRGTSADLLRELVGTFAREILESPASGIPKLMMAEIGNFPELAQFYYREVLQRVRELFRGVIRRGVEHGEFEVREPEHALRMLMAVMVMASMWKHSWATCELEPVDYRAYLASSVDIFLAGLAAPAGRTIPRAKRAASK